MFTFGIKDFYSTLYKCWSVMIRIDLTLKFIPYMWGGGAGVIWKLHRGGGGAQMQKSSELIKKIY